jgi:hypothetical protein
MERHFHSHPAVPVCSSVLNWCRAFGIFLVRDGEIKKNRETQVSKTEVPTLTELAELEAILRQLTLAALKLPPGDERRENLMTIGRFRERIAAWKQAALALATMLELKQSA